MEMAKLRQLLHRQHIAKHVGHMGKDRRYWLLTQGLVKGCQGVLPIKQLPARHCNPGSQGVKGAGDCVVLEARDHHPVPGTN